MPSSEDGLKAAAHSSSSNSPHPHLPHLPLGLQVLAHILLPGEGVLALAKTSHLPMKVHSESMQEDADRPTVPFPALHLRENSQVTEWKAGALRAMEVEHHLVEAG